MKINSNDPENWANCINRVLGRVQSENTLDISNLGNVRWLQKFWEG